MTEAAKILLGKKCIILSSASQTYGILRDVMDGAVIVETTSGLTTIINTRYIISITEDLGTHSNRNTSFSSSVKDFFFSDTE